MTKFSHRLHQTTFFTYFFYVACCVILVVFCSMITLQLLNWNEKKMEDNLTQIQIENLENELDGHIALLTENYIDKFDRKISGLKIAKAYFENPTEIKDTLAFLNEISYGAVGSYGIESLNRKAFESLIYTGGINSIETELRHTILNHYDYTDRTVAISQAQASTYQNTVNGLRPFYPESPTTMSKTDQIRYIEALHTEIFITDVNIELSNGLDNKRRAEQIIKDTKNLIHSIHTVFANH